MQIAIVHPSLTVRGGAERKILLYRQFLQSKGYKVDMYVFEYKKENTFHELIEEDHNIFVLPVKDNYISKIASWIKFGRQLRRYDHVIASNYPTNIVAAFAKNSKNTVSWICNEIAVQLIRRDNFFWNIFYSFEKWCNNKIDTVIVNSHSTGKKFYKYYLREANIVHSGIDPKAIDELMPEKRENWEGIKPFFLVLSRIEKHKNINFIMNISQKLEKISTNHKIIVAGAGDFAEEFQNSASTKENIIYVGLVTEAEKKYLYQNCEAFLFLPLDEPLGVTMMEALYQGKQIIAFNKGGPTEIITDTTLGYLCNSELDYLEAIAKCINSKENSSEEKHRQQHIRRNFSKKNMVENFYKKTSGLS
jgi:glycosyltransferase involved in cell wall biosynthesis